MQSPTKLRVVLASNSPRRRQLLRYILEDFDIAEPRDIDETYPANLAPEEIAPYISCVKARGYGDLATEGRLVLTADTVVILDNEILGKPHSEAEAVEMLHRLSERTHKVVTGVTLHSPDRVETFAEITRVHFGSLNDSEIEQYVAQYKPFDKAGAYGIQEWVGCAGIRGIEGCFYNVMGLPLNTLYNRLRTF